MNRITISFEVVADRDEPDGGHSELTYTREFEGEVGVQRYTFTKEGALSVGLGLKALVDQFGTPVEELV